MPRLLSYLYKALVKLVIVTLVLGSVGVPTHAAPTSSAHLDKPADDTSGLVLSIVSQNQAMVEPLDEPEAIPDGVDPEPLDLSAIDMPDVTLAPSADDGPSTWPALTCSGWWWCDPDTDAYPMDVVAVAGSSNCSVGEWSNLTGISGGEDESAAKLFAGACGGYYQTGIGSITVDFGQVFTDSGTSHSLVGNVYIQDSNSLYQITFYTSLDGQTWDWSSYNLWGSSGGWQEFGRNHADFKNGSSDVPPFRYVKLELIGREVNRSGVHAYYLGALRVSGGGTPVEKGLNEHPDQCYTGSCPTPAGCTSQNEIGKPINTRTGNYTYQYTDLFIPTVGDPLRLERTYIAHASSAITTAAVYSMPLGYGWTHSYNARLVFSGTVGGEPDTVIYQAPGGSRLRFEDNGDGTYTSFQGIKGTLERTSSTPYTYTLTAPSQQVYTFDSAGKLVAIRDAKGNETTLSYDGSSRLDRVTEPTGQRYLDFDYDASDRLILVTDHANRTVGYEYDASGDLTVVTDTRDYTWTYAYTGTHLLEAVYDPDGNLLEGQTYDDQGRVVTQTDELGQELTIAYGNSGDRTITDASARETRDQYGPQGTLVGQVDSTGSAPAYAYNDDFNKTSSVDALGNTTSYDWSSCGCAVETITDAMTHTTQMTYDQWNNLTSITDARDGTTTYAYETVTRAVNGQVITLTNLITVTDARDETTVYTYNERGQVTGVTDARGETTSYGYDTYGQQVAITDALGTVTTFEYDSLGRLVTTTVASGTSLARTTVNTYDDGDNLVRVVENHVDGTYSAASPSEDVVTQYGYDAVGRLLWVTDTLGYVTRSEYDAAGRLITSTANYTTGVQNYLDQYNLVTTFGYDAAGRQTWVTDTLGTSTRTWYDEVGRVISVTANHTTGVQNYLDQYNLITTYGYDAVGNRTHVTDTVGRVTCSWYDALNRVVSTTANYSSTLFPNHGTGNEYNLTTWYGYDEVGNQTHVTDTVGRVTRSWYDALNRAISVTANYSTGVSGHGIDNEYNLTTWYGYDEVGNQTHVTDTVGRVTRSWYDALGRVVSTTANYSPTIYPGHGAGNEWNLTTWVGYDAIGNRTHVTDTVEMVAYTAYDDLGRPLTTTANYVDGVYSASVPDEDVSSSRRYDGLGRVVETVDARGGVTSYEYDAAGRMTAVTDAMTGTTRYEYDALGRRTVVTDASGVAAYTSYDSLGRAVEVYDELGHTTEYVYDELSNRVAVTDARGIETRYDYDTLGRLVEVTEHYSDTGPTDHETNVTTSYGYDVLGNRTVVTDANGHATTYTYDDLSRLVSVVDPLTHTVSYAYDEVSNRTVITDAETQVVTYSYDALNRVTSILYPEGTVSYAYDEVSNRTAMTDATGTTTWMYDDLSRPITIAAPATGTVGYRYDAVDNRTKLIYPGGQVVTYTYDAAQRLEQVEDWSGETTTYGYDGAGRLLTTTLPNNVQTTYTYDDAGRLVEIEHTIDAETLASYQYVLDEVGNRVQVTETLRRPVDEVAALLLAVAEAEGRTRPPGLGALLPEPYVVDVSQSAVVEASPQTVGAQTVVLEEDLRPLAPAIDPLPGWGQATPALASTSYWVPVLLTETVPATGTVTTTVPVTTATSGITETVGVTATEPITDDTPVVSDTVDVTITVPVTGASPAVSDTVGVTVTEPVTTNTSTVSDTVDLTTTVPITREVVTPTTALTDTEPAQNEITSTEDISATARLDLHPEPDGGPGSWLQRERGVGYHATWRERTPLADLEAAYGADNYAQGLRAYFAPAGLRVAPGFGKANAWQWEIRVVGYGYGTDLNRPREAEIAPQGRRVAYSRGAVRVVRQRGAWDRAGVHPRCTSGRTGNWATGRRAGPLGQPDGLSRGRGRQGFRL
jgi:YD repeat-containing protein